MLTIFAGDKRAEDAASWVNRPYEDNIRQAVNLDSNETVSVEDEFFFDAQTTPEQDNRFAGLRAEGQALSDSRGTVITDVNAKVLRVDIVDEAGFAAAFGQ